MSKYHRNSAGFCSAYMLKCGSMDKFQNQHGVLNLTFDSGEYHVRLYTKTPEIEKYFPLHLQWKQFVRLSDARKHFTHIKRVMEKL